MLRNVSQVKVARKFAALCRPGRHPIVPPTVFLKWRLLSAKSSLAKQYKGTEKAPDPDKVKVTKKILLAQNSSRLSRLWVHIKWPLTRNDRPLTVDDMSAFASWLVMGNVLWIILGTTTFGFVAMYFVDTIDRFWASLKSATSGAGDDEGKTRPLKSQDTSFIAKLASSVLSHGLSLKYTFECGSVLPEFDDGMLKFKNVTVSLKPSTLKKDNILFTAEIPLLNLSLSFKKWYEGNGLIYNIEIYGMQAKVYRTHTLSEKEFPKIQSIPTFNSMALSFTNYYDSHIVQHDLNEHTLQDLESVAQNKHISLFNPNYNLANVKIHDSKIELYENDDTTPFRITIFNCNLPRLRGNRLLIDFFNAENVTGTVNNSMFTIHKHQRFVNSENTVRFKLDGIDMGCLSKANPQLKFNWLANGKAEIVADIRLPDFEALEMEKSSLDTPSVGFFKWIMDEIQDVTQPRVPTTVSPQQDEGLFKGAITALYQTFSSPRESEKEPLQESDYVIVNVKVKFRNLKATLPQFLPMASSAPIPFITLQNLRSLITYINSRDSTSPLVIKTTVIERLSDLYNMDVISQTRVFDVIVSDIYDDLSRMMKLDEKRIMDERTHLWSHALVSQLLLIGLGALA